ncbi:WG repeat-containing protein [Microscilla marina]|uniref:KWG n=1 Tax=Microscilla marina ATCC 23134 TaxID=313606 RepID=A1ZYR0_MICM2|nr:WG repeat-containing protein [Microscilla marina]EAY24484.1 conserved hypothetical protein [Microscilla marina ATCC 23134]
MRTHFFIILLCFLCTLDHTSLAQKATTFQNAQGKWGYKDKNGKVKIPAKYDYIRVASLKNSKRLIVIKDKKYALYTTDGNGITGFTYQMISVPNPDSQLILAKKSELYGYINSQGKTVLPFKYSNASNFKDGKANVWLNRRLFMIDTS